MTNVNEYYAFLPGQFKPVLTKSCKSWQCHYL